MSSIVKWCFSICKSRKGYQIKRHFKMMSISIHVFRLSSSLQSRISPYFQKKKIISFTHYDKYYANANNSIWNRMLLLMTRLKVILSKHKTHSEFWYRNISLNDAIKIQFQNTERTFHCETLLAKYYRRRALGHRNTFHTIQSCLEWNVTSSAIFFEGRFASSITEFNYGNVEVRA